MVPLEGLGLFWTWDFFEMGWPPPPLNQFGTWDFFEKEWPPNKISKQVEYEKYWDKLSQY